MTNLCKKLFQFQATHYCDTARILSPSTAKFVQDGLGGLIMGIGYTSGAYTGYGVSNTLDPLGLHSKSSYSRPQYVKVSQGMTYGYSSYGRRRYRRRRYSRYSGYRRYGYRKRRYYRARYY